MEEGDAAAEEALAAADVLGLDGAWSDTAVSQARARGDGDPVGTRRRMEEALERARRSGDGDVEMRVLYNRATQSPSRPGSIDEALAWTGQATARARELGMEWAFYPAELRHLQVTALYMAGEWDASLAEADALSRVPEMAAHVRAAGLLVLVGRGDPAARRAAGVGARPRPPAERAHAAHPGRGGRRDRPGGLAGRPADRGGASSSRPLAGCGSCGPPTTSGCSGCPRRRSPRWPMRRPRPAWSATSPAPTSWVAVGEPLIASARAAVDVFAKAVGEMGVEAKAWLARVEAEAARLRGEPAPELWQAGGRRRSATGTSTSRRAPAGGWPRRCWPPVTGRPPPSRRRAAHEVAVRLGAAPLRAAVEALVRRGRLDVDLPGVRRGPEPSAVFTPREAEVLALMAQGRTNRQIGAALYISEKTASVHVSNILAKLGADGRTEAVAIAASARPPADRLTER